MTPGLKGYTGSEMDTPEVSEETRTTREIARRQRVLDTFWVGKPATSDLSGFPKTNGTITKRDEFYIFDSQSNGFPIIPIKEATSLDHIEITGSFRGSEKDIPYKITHRAKQ